MNKATDPILELLAQVDIAISQNAIRYELSRTLDDPPHRSTVDRALNELEDRDYVLRPKGPSTQLITITKRGREYLDGERDAGVDS